MLEALVLKLKGEIAVAKANVEVYLNNAAGIGEHPDIVEAIETQIEKIASAEEKIETIQKHFNWIQKRPDW
jgi:hypothetical protein|tara:strand:- start:186 stop:398 length:213 start_codon:yes stop_codon:yes gene_type:complete